LLTLRLLALPFLLLWTALAAAQATPLALAFTLMVSITQTLRVAERWPRPLWRGRAVALGVELGLALALPLFTGGWRSPWLLDAWIVTAVVVRQASSRQLGGLLGLLIGYTVVLAAGTTPHFGDLGAPALVVLSMPAILVCALRQSTSPSAAAPDARLVVPLQTMLRRFEQIKADLGPERAGYEATTLLDAAMQASRGIRETQALLDLVAPNQTDAAAISERLYAIIGRWQVANAIAVEWMAQATPRFLPPLAESILVRALEESLANIKQHAKATQVEVELRTEDDSVLLIVRDNGIGLAQGSTQLPGVHGLRSLRYRVQEINGQMEVYERVDGGLVVQISVPLSVYAL
jgi:signal transduction histidine kinase